MLGDVLSLATGHGDVYTKLAIKVVQALEWAYSHVEATHFCKVDSDSFVAPLKLAAWLHAGNCRSGYCGSVLVDTPVVRAEGSKWFVAAHPRKVRPGFVPKVRTWRRIHSRQGRAGAHPG